MEYSINGYRVNNVPEYAVDEVENNGYSIVARYVDDELWFYGTYPPEEAEKIASYVNGWVLHKTERCIN